MMRNIIRGLVCIGFFILFSCKAEHRERQDQKEAISIIDSSMLKKEFVTGKFNPSQRSDFLLLERKFCTRDGMYLQRDCKEAFIRMWEAAKRDSIRLKVISATRNFERQKEIWERKWRGKTILSDGTNAADILNPEDRAKRILLYSSMPGSSRHHWGTDIDINNLNNSYFSSGKGRKEYEWLVKNGPIYGFCQPYSSKISGRTGYEEEKWHWSYLPISKVLTEFCRDHLRNIDISGFEGAEVAGELQIVTQYVMGVSNRCL